MRYVPGETGERRWGRWRVLEIGEGFCVKRIEVEPGHRLSLQYHHHRAEDWIIVGGAGLVELSADQIQVKSGDRIRIPLLTHHRILHDADGNLTGSHAGLHESRNSLAFGNSVRMIALGVDNLVIIASSEGVFVAPKHRAAEIKLLL